jgi:hypothetical protein
LSLTCVLASGMLNTLIWQQRTVLST